MQKHRWHHAAGLLIITLLVSGCASMPRHDPEPVDKVTYELSGKLGGASFFGTQRFTSKGEFALPQGGPAAVTER